MTLRSHAEGGWGACIPFSHVAGPGDLTGTMSVVWLVWKPYTGGGKGAATPEMFVFTGKERGRDTGVLKGWETVTFAMQRDFSKLHLSLA